MTELRWAADGRDAAVVEHVAALIARGPCTLALPGGATPQPMYAALAACDLPWAGVTMVPGDERLVPEGHPASNVGQLRAAFGATGATILPLAEEMAVPRLDLAWLGVGLDGHIASLFPNADPRADAPAAVVRVVPEPLPADAPFERLTLTLAALAAAGEILGVARGAAKRALLEAAATGANDLPVARLLAAAPRVTIFWSE